MAALELRAVCGARRLKGVLIFWSIMKIFLFLLETGSAFHVTGGLRVLIHYSYASVRLGSQDLPAGLGSNLSIVQGDCMLGIYGV